MKTIRQMHDEEQMEAEIEELAREMTRWQRTRLGRDLPDEVVDNVIWLVVALVTIIAIGVIALLLPMR
jgi:hypothetical protein